MIHVILSAMLRSTLRESFALRQWYAYPKGYRGLLDGLSRTLSTWLGMNDLRLVEENGIDANKTDKQGAQLSQECPPPINHKPIGTNNRTAQCRCLQCGRLFRLGLAMQVVQEGAKSFHAGALSFFAPI